MLYKILARYSSVVGVILLLVGSIAVLSQLLARPLLPVAGDNPLYPFGRPGIQMAVRKVFTGENQDGRVKLFYTFDDSNVVNIQSAEEIMMLDPVHFNVSIQTSNDEAKQSAAENRIDKQRIRINEVIERFEVLPVNKFQQAIFSLYDLVRFGCLAFGFFCFSAWFRLQDIKSGFIRHNAVVYRKGCLLLLVPQLLIIIAYLAYLSANHGTEQLSTSYGIKVKASAAYELYADVNIPYILVILVLLLLSYKQRPNYNQQEEKKQPA